MKQFSQIAVPQDGVHFVDILPEPKPGSVLIMFQLHGETIGGAWVSPQHGGTIDKPFPEVVEGSWVFWERRLEATCVAAERPAPRSLELL
jgi:hypothetical protein